jgi:hypothetical protein
MAVKFLHFNNPGLITSKCSERFRKKYQSRTVAAEPAEPETIRTLAKDFILTHPENQMLIYTLKIGVSRLHEEDTYVKKIGRVQALAKMEDIPLKVIGTTVTPTHIFVRLQNVKGLELSLRLNKTTNFSTVVGQLSGAD